MKLNLEGRAYREASMPDYNNLETIERDFDLYCTVKCKCAFYSRRCEYRSKEMRLFRFQHPGPRGGHLLPHERHRDRAYRKARMPENKNVETIVAIPRVWVLWREKLQFVQYCEMLMRFYAYAIHKLEIKILQKNFFFSPH